MKIGIYSGQTPPPIFITNLLNGLANNNYKVYIYGKSIHNKFKSNNPHVIIRRIYSRKIAQLFQLLFIIIKLFFADPLFCVKIIKIIWINAQSINHFIDKSCRILLPLLDGLDILHFQWVKTLIHYPEFINVFSCPILLSFRGTQINVSPIINPQIAQKYKKLLPTLSAYHAVSLSIAKESTKYDIDYNKISIIKPAVDDELLNYNIITKNISKRINMISVGRCNWIKGYTKLLDVLKTLKINKVDFHFTIVAQGKDYENIKYQIYDLELNNNITFINGLSHQEVINKLQQSNLFILSSFAEGISNSVLEAMALGVPVLTTNCGGMSEVIRDGYNGFIVPLRDKDAMVKKIQYFVKLDLSKKNNIIFNARKTIINNHLLSNQIKSFRTLYKSLIKD